MGLLRKRADEAEAAAAIADAELDTANSADAAVTADTGGVAMAPTAGVAPAADAPAEEAEPAGDDASDALLSMFHTTDEGSGDREMLLQMAGEVELPDLVDQLRTTAAALNISATRAR